MTEETGDLATAYRLLREPRHEVLKLRGLDAHLTRWGPPASESRPVTVLLHGWQDTADTFQFMVDALGRDRPLAALDWRGFGRSEWPQQGYWFPDYLADLDGLLDALGPGPASLVGHSMGGNVASLYAGLRPERVCCLVNMEGLGMPRTQPAAAPDQLRTWLDQVRSPPAVRDYRSFEQLSAVIQGRYPRFSATQVEFFARAWGCADVDGRVKVLGDPRHRWTNPIPYKREDAQACWRLISAPALMLLGAESEFRARLGADGTDDALRALIPGLEIVILEGAGHMLHIEQAAQVAEHVERFLTVHERPEAR